MINRSNIKQGIKCSSFPTHTNEGINYKQMNISSKHLEEPKSVSFCDFIMEADTEGAAMIGLGEHSRKLQDYENCSFPLPPFPHISMKTYTHSKVKSKNERARVAP